MTAYVVPPEEFGPAMLSLTEHQRRFVLEWFAGSCRDGAAAARRAGISDKSQGCKVYASQALRHPKVMAAIREEADKHMGVLSALAVMGLKRLLTSSNPKTQQKAIDSVLDRTGFGRSTTQDIRVEHVDKRSTAELLEAVRKLLPAPAPLAIEGTFKEVKAESVG